MFEELKKKRRPAGLSGKAITAWILFGMIILVFVFLDMNPQNGAISRGGAAAEVNTAVITESNLQNRVEAVRQSRGGEETDRTQLQMIALDSLINEELASQGAERQGLLVTDKQVAASIVEMDIFHEGGRFRQDRYITLLRANRLSPGDFESQQRRELLRQRAIRLMQVASKPNQLETDRQQAVQNVKANTEFLQIPAATVVKPDSLSEADITAFLAIAENEKKVKDHYEARKGTEFTREEEVNARHILVTAAQGDAKAEAAALKKIQDIRKRLEKEDFAKVAKQVSEDPGSKTRGGELGFFGRGRMVEEFEKVAFSAEPKIVSEPVRSSFGYHLIEVLEKRPAKVTAFDEAKTDIAKTLLAAERSEQQLDSLRELVKAGDMAAVNKWAQASGYNWEETGPFSIEATSVPKIGPSTEFADAAFRLTAEAPLLDRLIRQGPNAYVVRYKTVGTSKGEDSLNQFMKPDFMREVLANQRVQEISGRWLKQLRTESKVSVADRYNTGGKN